MIKMPLAIDISMWEADIDWEKLSPVPAIVIAKFSEYKWEDRLAVAHYQNAGKIGAKRSGYHFFRPNDVQSQIDKFLEVAHKAGAYDGKWLAELPPILDAEYAPPQRTRGMKESPISGSALAYQYKVWLDGVEKATGIRPIIYTNQNYWNYTKDWLGRFPSWSSDYKLWVAWYPDQPDKFDKPPASVIPSCFRDVVMWQYDEAGRLQGVLYDGVDLNWISPGFLASLGLESKPQIPLGKLFDQDVFRLNDFDLEEHVKQLHERYPQV